VSSPAVPWQRLLTIKIVQLHSFRSCLHRLPYRNQLNSLLQTVLVITSRHGPHRKYHSSIVAFVPVAAGTCLTCHCPETDAARITENAVLCCGRYLATAVVYRVTA
jgi:hypothetical protein